MRVNQFIARNTDLSRRKADEAIEGGRIEINGVYAKPGDIIVDTDKVSIDGKLLENNPETTTILINKPAGYVVSRNGQGSKTVYELLPSELSHLQAVGRLDKDSSGLLLLTNDGQQANRLTHPRYNKLKIYLVCLDKPLSRDHFKKIVSEGVKLKDGLSSFELKYLDSGAYDLQVNMHEGRNRQIRRTFAKLDYKVTKLHRIQFGNHRLGDLGSGNFIKVSL